MDAQAVAVELASLPPSSLVLLVGPPAAGKSTLAATLVDAGVVDADDVLSTDTYREALTGSALDTTKDRKVWSIVRRGLESRMAAGRTTVVDATNLFPQRRARHIRAARAHGRPVVAIRVQAPTETLIERNDARDRVLPLSVVLSMARHMREQAQPETLAAEGVDLVIDVGYGATGTV